MDEKHLGRLQLNAGRNLRYADRVHSSRPAGLTVVLLVMFFAFVAPLHSRVLAAVAVLLVFGGMGLLAAVRASRAEG